MNTQLLEDDGTDVNLSEVQELVKQLVKKQDDLATKEMELKTIKEDIAKLESVTIPEKMGNLTEIKLEVNGVKKMVKVKDVLRANIKKELKDEAYIWLDEHEHGDLIKTEISLPYPRAQLEAAKEAMQQLKDLGFNPVIQQDIHWATLDSWAREQDAQGIEFPPFIGIFKTKKVEVKDGK